MKVKDSVRTPLQPSQLYFFTVFFEENRVIGRSQTDILTEFKTLGDADRPEDTLNKHVKRSDPPKDARTCCSNTRCNDVTHNGERTVVEGPCPLGYWTKAGFISLSLLPAWLFLGKYE